MFEVQILVPLADNDGNTFTASDFEAFERFILDRFEGLTRLPGTAQGKWLDGGDLYADRLLVYVVACNSIAQGAAVAEVAEEAKRRFRQLAVAVRYFGRMEIL